MLRESHSVTPQCTASSVSPGNTDTCPFVLKHWGSETQRHVLLWVLGGKLVCQVPLFDSCLSAWVGNIASWHRIPAALENGKTHPDSKR